jgi:hypothetical protein
VKEVPLIVLLVASLLVVTVPTGANQGSIQPGDQVSGVCTLNYVFDGVGDDAGRVFIGTAAHCLDLGEVVSTAGFNDFGTVVYDGGAGDGLDFALIEIDPQYHGSVKAHVAGHPDIPSGLATWTDTQIGDLLLLSGHGIGLGAQQTVRENRVGPLVNDDPDQFYAEVPTIFGDSGGPVAHTDPGAAFGLVTGIIIGVPTYALYGPAIDGAIDDAQAAGFDIELRTV